MSVTRLGIFSTLDKFLKPLATINLPKSPTILGNFCKGVKIYHFSIEIIFVQLSWTFANFSGHTAGHVSKHLFKCRHKLLHVADIRKGYSIER